MPSYSYITVHFSKRKHYCVFVWDGERSYKFANVVDLYMTTYAKRHVTWEALNHCMFTTFVQDPGPSGYVQTSRVIGVMSTNFACL